jgi:hypothetical protein
MVSVPLPLAHEGPSWMARLTVGRSRETCRQLSAEVRGLGRRGAVLSAASDVGAATHAWLELALPGGGTIRPLVELGDASDGQLPVRFRHVSPRDRGTLEAYHAARATPAGY